MKTALVTGGQRGIGRAIAEALSGAGWAVVIAAEVPHDHPDVLATLAATGARYVRHDLADIAAIPATLEAVGPVTCLVANAGVAARVRADMLEVAPEDFDFVMDINCRGTFFLAQAVARAMVGAPSEAYRSLLFVTSVSAAFASVERAEYCVSKSAGAMMAQLFAVRLASEGIGVFDLRPGIIETPMTAGIKDKYSARITGGLVPAARWGTGADVAQTVVPLASGAFGFASGMVVPVDGGLSIPRL
ncbi:MAG: 3-ketoacyl-ACP reductase [Pseudomonadota bacterium]